MALTGAVPVNHIEEQPCRRAGWGQHVAIGMTTERSATTRLNNAPQSTAAGRPSSGGREASGGIGGGVASVIGLRLTTIRGG